MRSMCDDGGGQLGAEMLLFTNGERHWGQNGLISLHFAAAAAAAAGLTASNFQQETLPALSAQQFNHIPSVSICQQSMPVIWSCCNSNNGKRVIKCQCLHKWWKCFISKLSAGLQHPEWNRGCMMWSFDDHNRQWPRSLVSDGTSSQASV